MKDIVFAICAEMLRSSPEQSYKRLNPALRSTLSACIESDLPFQRSTFRKIYDGLRGGWWFGDGSGSHIGEHFYTQACRCNHASAQQSFEEFAGRPACLWEQDAKNPSRLHAGAEFSWKGHYLTVTSMRKDSLVGCTYKDYRPSVRGLKVGATICYSPEYIITSSKKTGASTALTVVQAKANQGDREVARRFVITYDQIAQYRREAKVKLKAVLETIAQCDPEKDSKDLTAKINAAGLRHWELEDVQAAFSARKEWLSNEKALDGWRSGEGGAWFDLKVVALRVNGDLIECSNGNSVSKAAAARALPILLANRSKNAAISYRLDAYTINRVNPSGVKVGCTLVPWPEIDRIAPALA